MSDLAHRDTLRVPLIRRRVLVELTDMLGLVNDGEQRRGLVEVP